MALVYRTKIRILRGISHHSLNKYELAKKLKIGYGTLGYHLKEFRRHGLTTEHRVGFGVVPKLTADGRFFLAIAER